MHDLQALSETVQFFSKHSTCGYGALVWDKKASDSTQHGFSWCSRALTGCLLLDTGSSCDGVSQCS